MACLEQLVDEFLAYAKARNLTITDPKFDEEVHYFDTLEEDGGWYVGVIMESTKNSEPFLCVSFGDHCLDKSYVFTPEMRLTRRDREEAKEKDEKARILAEKDLERRRRITADKALRMYNSLPDAGDDHPYLKKKKIGTSPGIKILEDTLFIPVKTAHGLIAGAQFIKPDGKRYFMKAQRTKGCMFVLGDLKGADNAEIAEGYSTAASVRLATKNPVVCAFSAGNLADVARELRHAYPKVNFRVCGDDDHSSASNPGRKAAQEAAGVFKNRPKFPAFSNYDGEDTSDFNDLHVREGIEAVEDQLAFKTERASYQALGVDGSNHFFLSHVTNTILRFKTFGPDNLLQLFVDYDELEERFGNDTGGINWDRVKHCVISDSMSKGIFNPQRVRGVGTWKDGNSTVVNTGQELIVDGKFRSMGDIESVYTYTSSKLRFRKPGNPLTTAECGYLLEVIRMFSWEHPDSVALLAGWLALARIAGALPIRPHLWITAGEGVGKSTLFELILISILGGSEGYVEAKGQSTAAGIRQTLKGDALPLIYDEFETEEKNNIQKGAIELIRQAWSRNNARILKGTSDGTAMDFDPQFCSLVSSIKVHLENAQDKGRFSVLELSRHNGNARHAERMQEAAAKITEDYGHRLFARSIKNIDNILEGHKAFKAAITGMGHTSRLGDQVGMLLSGYFSLIADHSPSKKEAQEICGKMKQLTDKNILDTRRDEDLCLEHLLTSKVRFTVGDEEKSVSHEMTIAGMINGSPAMQERLSQFGMKIKGEFLAVANTHVALKKLFDTTHWKNWTQSLGRLPGSQKRQIVYIDRRNVRCIYIPLHLVVQCKETVIPLPKRSCSPAYITTKELVFSDGCFPAGTEVEVVRNIFTCADISQEDKVGLARQLKKNADLMVIRMGERYRAINPGFVASRSS